MAVKPVVENFIFIAVTNLAPGNTYTMEVVAYKKKYTSQSASITVKTDGEPLPQISGLVCIEFVHTRMHVLVHLMNTVGALYVK